MARLTTARSSAVVEIVRLCVVVAFTALGFQVGGTIEAEQAALIGAPVSYTHLTLPTIYSV